MRILHKKKNPEDNQIFGTFLFIIQLYSFILTLVKGSDYLFFNYQ